MIRCRALSRRWSVALAASCLLSSIMVVAQAPNLPKPKPITGGRSEPKRPVTGTVKINTEADCTLIVGEESHGVLSVNEVRNLQLREGTHLLKALDATGAVRWSQWVKVRAGGEEGLTVRFGKAPEPVASLPPVKLPAGAALVEIPPGTFDAGCPPGIQGCKASELPRRQVTLTRRFWMLATPVTVAQFRAYASDQKLPPVSQHGRIPRQFQPIVYVTWADAAGYCAWMEGRLPTEAEWERAAQTGASAGIRDMGSYWEWTDEWFSPTPPSSTTNPRGPAAGQNRVVRAGNRALPRRDHLAPGGRYEDVAFRCVTDRPE